MPRTFSGLTAEAVADAVYETIPQIATSLRDDVAAAIVNAYSNEDCDLAKSIISQIAENDCIGRSDGAPICQDTGSVWVYLEVGEELSVPGNVFSLVDDAVARAYEESRLRMSIVSDALVDRSNTKTNTPVFTEIGFRPGDGATLHIMLKGGGSDNASRVVMLPPGLGFDGICEEVRRCVIEKGSAACPPLMIGIGVGSTFDKVAGLAKKALLRPVGQPSNDPQVAKCEQRLLEIVNSTGIGPAGLGGKTTAVSVAINTAPCHIAALPLAINMGCCAMRSASLELSTKCSTSPDDETIVELERQLVETSGNRFFEDAVDIEMPASKSELSKLKAGQMVRISGVMYTMRDAGHERALELLGSGEPLPFDPDQAVLLYAGPTPAKAGRPFGSIGPTTASRMDFATPEMFKAGIGATVGKGKRSKAVVAACKEQGCVHFTCIGGIAALLATFVKSAETVAWDELGTEALVKVEVEGLPALVAIDVHGNDVYDMSEGR